MSSLQIKVTEMEGLTGPVAVVSIQGFVPPCAEGNASIDALRPAIERIASAHPNQRLILDFLDVDYSFGDHFGSLWILPLAKYGCTPIIVADGATAKVLDSFITGNASIRVCSSLREALSVE